MAPLLTRARTPSSRAGRGGTTAREKIPPGFPTGEGIRRALAGFFREQKRLALGNPDRLLATAKAGGPWDKAGLGADELAERLIPALGAIWDASGEGEAGRANAVRARSGLPPIAWDPSSPEVAEAIAAHARTLAGNLQGVTEDQTLEALRGGSEAGESPEQLRDRLITLFRGMETARAERIARTEAIRAHNAAANLAATRSGVVAGWEWVAGGDACSLCREIAARCRYQRLGQPFAVVGGHADYASVPHPPAHPHCACTLAPVLLPEYGGPEDVEWGVRGDQSPVDFSDWGWGLGKLFGLKKPAAPQRAWQPPILPGKPMADRLAAYTEGDRKVKAIQALAQGDPGQLIETIGELEDVRNEINEITNYINANKNDPVERPIVIYRSARRRYLVNRHKSLLKTKKRLIEEAPRDEVLAILVTSHPFNIDLKQTYKNHKNDPLYDLNSDQLAEVEHAKEWFASLLQDDRRNGPLVVKVGSRAPNTNERAEHHIGIITLGPQSKAKTIIHEMGHAIDFLVESNPGNTQEKVGHSSYRFLLYRIGNEPSVYLNSVIPGNRYDKTDRGCKDEFDEYFPLHLAYYCGLRVRGIDRSEILSIGLEYLYIDPVGFATKAPEYCKFVLGILDGSLR